MVRVIVIAAVLLTSGIAGFRELKNYLEYPCLQEIETPRVETGIILYHRGARDRSATVFVSAVDPREAPSAVTQINYGEIGVLTSPPPCGELRWTNDQTSLYATGRNTRGESNGVILWIYDTVAQNLLVDGDIDEASGNIFTQPVFKKILTHKGGGGKPIASWYEMGKKSDYLFSWKAAHWDRLAKGSAVP